MISLYEHLEYFATLHQATDRYPGSAVLAGNVTNSSASVPFRCKLLLSTAKE